MSYVNKVKDREGTIYDIHDERIAETTAADEGKVLQVNAEGKLNLAFAKMEDIVDLSSQRRFIEALGEVATDAGVTITYNAYSLSGTHLMIVLAGTIANGDTLLSNKQLAKFTIPSWIADKIHPVWGGIYIERKNVTFVAEDWNTQTASAVLIKESDGSLRVRCVSGFTATKDAGFRIQFDLLID